MPAVLQRYAQIPYPLRQAFAAALWVLFGLCILPAGIFAAGVALLGRYDGGSLEQTYASIFSGLGTGSAASWGVVLGPYLLFLLLKGLLLWWRTAAKWAA